MVHVYDFVANPAGVNGPVNIEVEITRDSLLFCTRGHSFALNILHSGKQRVSFNASTTTFADCEPFSTGSYTIKATVDKENLVPESDEENNWLAEQLQVS